MHTVPVWLTTVAALAVPYAMVLATPGPNLLVMVQASLMRPARGAPAAAVGIACGATLAVAVAALGTAVLPPGRGFEVGGRLVFAFLLARAGAQTLRSSLHGDGLGRAAQGRSRHGPFRLGLFTALSNPLTVPFFAGFFLAQAGNGVLSRAAAPCALVFLMAGGWFGAIGALLSHSRSGALLDLARSRLEPVVGLGLVGYAAVTLWPVLRG